MFGADNYWLVSEALLILTFISFLVVFVLTPSRRKVLEEGKDLPGWVPIVLMLMIATAVGVGIFALLMVKENIIILISDSIVIVALVLTIIDHRLVKRAVNKMVASHVAHELPITEQAHADHQHLHAQGHLYAEGIPMMTVECPTCKGHIEIPEGSHTLTCPYCGLHGSL